MSTIGRVRRPTAIDPAPMTVPEAIAALLVAAITVDGTVVVEEAVRIGDVLGTTNLLHHVGNGSTQALANRALVLLTDDGLPAVLTRCAKVIPSDLRTTVFALATDLTLADGRMGDREKAFLDELQGVLLIDDATAAKIVEVLLIKNRG